MSIFDHLPTLEKCCFCISLKWGTIIIAIIGILNGAHEAVNYLDYPCGSKKSAVQIFLDNFIYVVIVIDLLLFITSILLFAGVFMKKPQTATWFMYIAGLYAIIMLIYGILTIIDSVTNKACRFRYVCTSSRIVTFFIWVYFIIVVKSYQEEMKD